MKIRISTELIPSPPMLCLLSSFAVVLAGLALVVTILIPFARGLAVKGRDIF